MDGNGRWASRRGLTRTEGHRAGAENMLPILRACLDLGVQYLTVYIFSTENWNRSDEEVTGMLQLVEEFLDRELMTIHAWGVRLHHLGDLERISSTLKQKVQFAIELTQHNRNMTLGVALDYGSRADLVRAVRAIVAKGIPPESIDEETIAAHLSTGGMPAPDLVIRTSGEQRLSNFLLWESAHSNVWTTPVCWPEFTAEHLYEAIFDQGA
jgi:undecaprenyl diphosphate synthase